MGALREFRSKDPRGGISSSGSRFPLGHHQSTRPADLGREDTLESDSGTFLFREGKRRDPSDGKGTTLLSERRLTWENFRRRETTTFDCLVGTTTENPGSEGREK